MGLVVVVIRQLEVDVAEPSDPSRVGMDLRRIQSVATCQPCCLLAWRVHEVTRRGDGSSCPPIFLVLAASRGLPPVPQLVILIVDPLLPLQSGATYGLFPERRRVKEGDENKIESLLKGLQLAGKLGLQIGTG